MMHARPQQTTARRRKRSNFEARSPHAWETYPILFVFCTLVATLSITVIFVEGEHIKGVKNVFYVHSQGAHAHTQTECLKCNNEVVIGTCKIYSNVLMLIFYFSSFHVLMRPTRKYSSQQGVFIIQCVPFLPLSVSVEHEILLRP